MSTATAEERPHQDDEASLVRRTGRRFGIDPDKLLSTLKATSFRVKDSDPPISNEQMMMLLIVAEQYRLNPFTREVYAYPDKTAGIVPVVSVDGWLRIINEHPAFNGMEIEYSPNMIVLGKDGEHPPAHEWCEVKIYRKDREFPTVVREFLDEVYREPFKGTNNGREWVKEGPWQSHPKRLLRHKTIIQGARVAFGFAGLYDDDEARRIIEGSATRVPDSAMPGALPAALEDINARVTQTHIPPVNITRVVSVPESNARIEVNQGGAAPAADFTHVPEQRKTPSRKQQPAPPDQGPSYPEIAAHINKAADDDALMQAVSEASGFNNETQRDELLDLANARAVELGLTWRRKHPKESING